MSALNGQRLSCCVRGGDNEIGVGRIVVCQVELSAEIVSSGMLPHACSKALAQRLDGAKTPGGILLHRRMQHFINVWRISVEPDSIILKWGFTIQQFIGNDRKGILITG